jgi:drug/metabolite transporter (DMT)-like permease
MAAVPSADSLGTVRFCRSRMWRSIPKFLCPNPMFTRYGTLRRAVRLAHVGVGRALPTPTAQACAATQEPHGTPRIPSGRSLLGACAQTLMPSLLILVSAALYGVSPILAKVAYSYGVSTLTLLAVRSTFTTACLWLGLVLTRRPVHLSGAALGALLVTGTTLLPVQVFSYFWALVAYPASSASVLVFTYPLLVAWMGWIFLRERVRPDEVAMMIVIVAGALLVAGQTPVLGAGLELLALAVATMTAALAMIVLRWMVRRIEPVTAMAILAPASAVIYWSVGLAAGQLDLRMPAVALVAILGLAVLANLSAPLLLLSGLKSVQAARASILGTLEPVVTVSLSVLFLSDAVTPLRALGIAIVIGGIALLHVQQSRPAPPGPPP